MIKGVDFMPFMEANLAAEEKKLQELMKDPEVKQHIDEWEQEYELRKKMRMTRKQADMSQKVLGMLSGLDHRAISRVETNTGVSPNLKTVVKYLNALGYRLEVVPK
ncbi:MAG: helix-turn-helix domain-containing protein [Clostridiales bacterium]|jgi:DNA-binding XRE family transcriptional regulator|nr:helix-turn-helix domain-containing protein [Clostridiales bacterium]